MVSYNCSGQVGGGFSELSVLKYNTHVFLLLNNRHCRIQRVTYKLHCHSIKRDFIALPFCSPDMHSELLFMVQQALIFATHLILTPLQCKILFHFWVRYLDLSLNAQRQSAPSLIFAYWKTGTDINRDCHRVNQYIRSNSKT